MAAVTEAVGNEPVTRRVYVKGDDTAERLTELEESITQHVEYLKPGGLYATGLLRKKGEEALASLNKQYEELSALGHKAKDRWEYQELGMTFAQRWEGKPLATVTEDLIAAGISMECHPMEKGGHKLSVPRDLQQRFAKHIKHKS